MEREDQLSMQIFGLEISHDMWTYLKQQYLQESAYSFVAQIQGLIVALVPSID